MRALGRRRSWAHTPSQHTDRVCELKRRAEWSLCARRRPAGRAGDGGFHAVAAGVPEAATPTPTVVGHEPRSMVSQPAKGQRGRTMRNWTDSSTLGVVGCFFVFLLLLVLAGWIALKIMEGMSPA
jgi:hypothetical protein